MSTLYIKQTTTYEENDTITVTGEDDYGNQNDLGYVSLRTQDVDDEKWFEGFIDTRSTSANDLDELVRILTKRFPNDYIQVI